MTILNKIVKEKNPVKGIRKATNNKTNKENQNQTNKSSYYILSHDCVLCIWNFTKKQQEKEINK